MDSLEKFVAMVQKPNRIAIPKEIMEIEGIKAGDLVRVELQKIVRK